MSRGATGRREIPVILAIPGMVVDQEKPVHLLFGLQEN
jgi:hypothetical protein